MFYVCVYTFPFSHSLVSVNSHRKVSGVVRGYDQFMNIVLEDAVEEVSQAERNNLGICVGDLITQSHF